MAYPSNDTDIPLKFLRMGGLNQRIAKHALPAPDFSVLQGLYPAQDGLLERLSGIRPLALAGDNTVAIWQIFQPNDGTDNVIIQTSDGTERTFTLNELFGRTVVSNLTYTPLQDDENMPTATIIQDTANTVPGSSIGANPDTWYQRTLTSNPLNESSIIVSFAANAFELAPGTYRLRGFVSASLAMTATGNNIGSPSMGFQAAVVNTTDSTTILTGSPARLAFSRVNAQNNAIAATVYSYFDGTFAVSGGNKTFTVWNAYSTGGSNTTFSALEGSISGVLATLNGAALRQPYVTLNIAKVA